MLQVTNCREQDLDWQNYTASALGLYAHSAFNVGSRWVEIWQIPNCIAAKVT